MSGMISQMSRSGRETLPDVWEWWESLPDVREWLGDPSGCLALVGRLSRLSGSGQETLPDV